MQSLLEVDVLLLLLLLLLLLGEGRTEIVSICLLAEVVHQQL